MNLKDDVVRSYRTRADTVAYIGDGRWDLHALRNADLKFAIKNSKFSESAKNRRFKQKLSPTSTRWSHLSRRKC